MSAVEDGRRRSPDERVPGGYRATSVVELQPARDAIEALMALSTALSSVGGPFRKSRMLAYAAEQLRHSLWRATVRRDKRQNQTVMNRRTLLDKFRELEQIAGVKHGDGRGLYGVRRIMARLVMRETKDEEVRDAAGGWTSGGNTRRVVYDPEPSPSCCPRRPTPAAARRKLLQVSPQEVPDSADATAVLRATLASMGMHATRSRC